MITISKEYYELLKKADCLRHFPNGRSKRFTFCGKSLKLLPVDDFDVLEANKECRTSLWIGITCSKCLLEMMKRRQAEYLDSRDSLCFFKHQLPFFENEFVIEGNTITSKDGKLKETFIFQDESIY